MSDQDLIPEAWRPVTNARPKPVATKILAGKDPTKTTKQVMAFLKEFKGRVRALSWSIRKYVGAQDVFGLAQPVTQNAVFQTDATKLKSFRSWLDHQIKAGLLEEVQGSSWATKYIKSVYKQGVINAYQEVHTEDMAKPLPFQQGALGQFLQDSFNQPEMLSKVEMLATRTYDSLQGFSQEMGTKLNRLLSDGMIQGQSPKEVASKMAEQLDIDLWKAERIARTELMHAHAEGQLDSFEAMGIDDLGLVPEILTLGNACPLCVKLAKKRYTVQTARGVIPAHPNCRCSWTSRPA